MNTQNLKVGEIYKNYKVLCEVLDEEQLRGNPREYQIKRWGSYFSYHKEGQKFIIDEIYDTPKTIVTRGNNENSHNNRTLCGKEIRDLIKKSSVITGGAVATSFGKLTTEIIPIFADYNIYDENEVISLAKQLDMKPKYVKDYYSFAKRYVKKQFKSALEYLQNKNVLRYELYYSIKPIQSEAIDLEAKDTEIIHKAEEKACKKLGFKETRQSMGLVFQRGMYEEFKQEVINILNEDKTMMKYTEHAEIQNYWECVAYEFLDSYTEEFTQEEYEQALVTDTHAIITALHHTFEVQKTPKSQREVDRNKFGSREEDYLIYANDKARTRIVKLDSVFFNAWTEDYKDTKNKAYKQYYEK